MFLRMPLSYGFQNVKLVELCPCSDLTWCWNSGYFCQFIHSSVLMLKHMQYMCHMKNIPCHSNWSRENSNPPMTKSPAILLLRWAGHKRRLGDKKSSQKSHEKEIVILTYTISKCRAMVVEPFDICLATSTISDSSHQRASLTDFRDRSITKFAWRGRSKGYTTGISFKNTAKTNYKHGNLSMEQNIHQQWNRFSDDGHVDDPNVHDT